MTYIKNKISSDTDKLKPISFADIFEARKRMADDIRVFVKTHEANLYQSKKKAKLLIVKQTTVPD
jgi:hypothetical protein